MSKTWCEELTHLKRPWFWERLRAGGEEDDRGWDGWMASLTWWTWVWVTSGSYWWTGRPGVLQSLRSQRVGYTWATELNFSIWDLSSLTRDWTHAPCIGTWSFNHWTTREVPAFSFCSFTRRGQEVEMVWVSPLSKHEKWDPGPRWKDCLGPEHEPIWFMSHMGKPSSSRCWNDRSIPPMQESNMTPRNVMAIKHQQIQECKLKLSRN